MHGNEAVSMVQKTQRRKNVTYQDQALPAELIPADNRSGNPRVLYKVGNNSEQVHFHKRHTALSYGWINDHYCKVMLQDICLHQHQVKAGISLPLCDYGLFPSF